MFTTIFLDADDTVFDFGKAQYSALKSAFNALNYPFNEEIYKIYDEINISEWKKLERGETTKEKLVYDRFYRFFEKTKIKGDVIKVEEEYQTRLGNYAFWLDGAKEGVEYLAKKYNVYIVTNGHGETQKNRLRISGLKDMVKGVFISEIVGYAKPSIEYYDYCLNAVGAQKGDVLCIGDSLTSDILGGNNAGLKTMWYNPKHSKNPDLNIDYVVSSWEQIRQIL